MILLSSALQHKSMEMEKVPEKLVKMDYWRKKVGIQVQKSGA